MPVREISSQLQEVAIKELNEDPKRIESDLAYIKEWLSKQPHIKARTDDQFLIAFLRGTKFSLERTKEKLDLYYTLKTIAPELYKNRDPFDPEIQKILSLGTHLPLPKLADPSGPRYILARAGFMEQYNLDQAASVKLNSMFQDIMLLEDDNFTISGAHFVQDLSGVSVNFMKLIQVSIMRKAMMAFQHAYPNRIKGGHFFNIPKIFDALFAIIKPFLTEKLKRRMGVYSSLEELQKTIPVDILPEEYGGQGGKIADITEYWKTKIESYRDWFLEDEAYGTDEKRRPGKPKTSESVFGLDGSFRQLVVD